MENGPFIGDFRLQSHDLKRNYANVYQMVIPYANHGAGIFTIICPNKITQVFGSREYGYVVLGGPSRESQMDYNPSG